jgi:myosin heavy subunit
MSETMPEAFGLSIVFSGQHESNPQGVFARCAELYGCDIVKNPAANPTGLFSAPVDTQEPNSMKNDQAKNLEVELSQTSAALKDAEAKLAEQAAQLTALVAERDGAKAKADELTAAEARNLDALQAAATEINAFKTQVAELQAKLDATEKSVSQRVADEIAKLGVPPIDGKPVNPEPTAEQLQAEYDRLAKTDFAAARAFWKANETKLQDPKVLAAVQRHLAKP